MNSFLKFDSSDDVVKWAFEMCRDEGEKVSPRGMLTYEVPVVGFELTSPRKRKISWSKRGWSSGLGAAEAAWHLSGSRDVDILAHYAKSWKKYSDDGLRVNGSCYGAKIFSGGENSQWEVAKQILKNDLDSRRSVIVTDATVSSDLYTLDKSCLTSMQFLVRDGRLHAVVNMRSNDVYLGLPYDIFLFTIFQERMAFELDISLGSYFHIASSFHLYDRDLERVNRKGGFGSSYTQEMATLDFNEVNNFIAAEVAFRKSGAWLGNVSSGWEELVADLRNFANK
ncbi:MAG: hypothetical protein CL820_06605 [Croceicoccus sp.]|nr:hypothetical protein [Croceicoccus sp.]|tara:strand:- start:118 stop:963 length:846 start_codon:yes stop_codon:yes gene_type:complete